VKKFKVKEMKKLMGIREKVKEIFIQVVIIIILVLLELVKVMG